jgi:hypothetical protein
VFLLLELSVDTLDSDLTNTAAGPILVDLVEVVTAELSFGVVVEAFAKPFRRAFLLLELSVDTLDSGLTNTAAGPILVDLAGVVTAELSFGVVVEAFAKPFRRAFLLLELSVDTLDSGLTNTAAGPILVDLAGVVTAELVFKEVAAV